MDCKKFKCPCCGYCTLDRIANNTFQICPVCYWEDDGVQSNDTDFEGGANDVSLNQAKTNFRLYGAIEEKFKRYVRHPKSDELDPN